MAQDLTDDAFLGGRLTVLQPRAGYRAATDPVFLAAAVPATPNDSMLELGCGVGVASLCLAVRTGAQVTGLELQPDYAALARENARRNGLDLRVFEGDLSAIPDKLRTESFDHVMFNPPYFPAGAGTSADDPGRELANREATPLATWVDAALRRVKPKGWLTVIQRSERLPDLLAALDGRAGSITALPLGSRNGRDAGRVVVRARKGGRAPFVLKAPFILHTGTEHTRDGDDFTPDASAILRDGAALGW
ncbi:MAG: tRNA1(Val) (adenine(37)-N6)-methyltransferase [Brevirhabdus sp.]